MPTGGGGGSGGRAGDIRAGGAVWEISAKDSYSAKLRRAAADTKKFSAEMSAQTGRIGEGFNKITSVIGASGFAGEFGNALTLASNSAFGLKGAIVTLGAVGAIKLGELVSGTEKFNQELEKGRRLSGEVAEGLARIRAAGREEALATNPAELRLIAQQRLLKEAANSKAGIEQQKRDLEELIRLAHGEGTVEEATRRFGATAPPGKGIMEHALEQSQKELKDRFGTMFLQRMFRLAGEEVDRLNEKLKAATQHWKEVDKDLKKTNAEVLGGWLEMPNALDSLIDKAKEFAKAWAGNRGQSAFGKIAARNAMVEDLQKLPGQVAPIIGGFQQFLDDWTRPEGPLGAWGKLAAGLESSLGFVRGTQGGGDLQAMLGIGDRFDRLDRAQLEVQQDIKQEVKKLPPAIANEFAAQFRIK